MDTTSGLPPGIDLTALKGLGAEYRAITGLPLLLVDTEGRRLWGIGNCPLCALLSDSPKREKICGDHERRAVEESFRWGEAVHLRLPLRAGDICGPAVAGRGSSPPVW